MDQANRHQDGALGGGTEAQRPTPEERERLQIEGQLGNERVLERQVTDERGAAAREEAPRTGELVGEAAGGISGTLAGAALGSLAGPIGTVIGAIAGAVGGWWTGRAVAEAAENFGREEEFYREHYETGEARLTDRAYDDVRPAYQLGYLASRNPEYGGREFDDIEPELQRGWNEDLSARYGEWATVRSYVATGYSGRQSAAGAEAAEGAASAEGVVGTFRGESGPDQQLGSELDASSTRNTDASTSTSDERERERHPRNTAGDATAATASGDKGSGAPTQGGSLGSSIQTSVGNAADFTGGPGATGGISPSGLI